MDIVKKEHYVFGNSEYQSLKHFPEVVKFKKGRYRITEKTYEYLERMHGYRPSPEVAIQRKIQVKVLWWWKTLAKQSIKPNSIQLIRAWCFGERYNYEPSWIAYGFGEEALNELNRKK